MKKSHFILPAFFLSLVSCYSPTNNIYQAEKTKGVDFKNYKTFAWLPSKSDTSYNKLASAKTVENALSAAVIQQLTKRGMVLDSLNPDCLFTYTLVLNKTYQLNQQPNPVYAPNTQPGLLPGQYNVYYYQPQVAYNYNPNSYDGYMKVTTFRDGSLVLDMIDRKQNKIVWRSTAQGKVDEKDARGVRPTINDIVPVMFKKFPISN